MNHTYIINALESNQAVFATLFDGVSRDVYLWKPQSEKWCLLEVLCHLLDEEREDFRARVRHVLETPNDPLPPIDPQGWVAKRDYLDQNYETMLKEFLAERQSSVRWLNALKNPNWGQAYQHPKFGPMTAGLFLANWLAHDYLHFRQITRLKYGYLDNVTTVLLDYAGEW